MIGATRSEAESTRDSQKLTTPVYACAVQFGVFDEQKLQLQDVFDNVSKRL